VAGGIAVKFPKVQPDGSIERETFFKNAEGKLERMTETIFSAETPVFSETFSDKITELINDGTISFPTAANAHLVEISDQLEEGKFTYDVVDADGDPRTPGDIFRVFLNGICVSKDCSVSGSTFTFNSGYSAEDFGYPDQILIIDYIEEN
jgi:hypothetical protein